MNAAPSYVTPTFRLYEATNAVAPPAAARRWLMGADTDKDGRTIAVFLAWTGADGQHAAVSTRAGAGSDEDGRTGAVRLLDSAVFDRPGGADGAADYRAEASRTLRRSSERWSTGQLMLDGVGVPASIAHFGPVSLGFTVSDEQLVCFAHTMTSTAGFAVRALMSGTSYQADPLTDQEGSAVEAEWKAFTAAHDGG